MVTRAFFSTRVHPRAYVPLKILSATERLGVMVTVNNPTGAVMAIPERTGIVIVRDARLFARRFDSGISDRHCVIIDGPFYPARGAGCLSAMHFSPTVVNGAAGRGDREYASRIPYVLHVNNTRPLRFRSPTPSF